MSHTLEFETTITNQDALVSALKRMGIPENLIEVHETAQRLKAYHEEEVKYAHVIVRRDLNEFSLGTHSDYGWERNADGVFVGHIDGFNYKVGPQLTSEWQQKLYTYCNVETMKMEFGKQHMECVETVDKQGRIQLRAKFAKAQENKNRTKTYTTVKA
jgi:hypothetical protein